MLKASKYRNLYDDVPVLNQGGEVLCLWLQCRVYTNGARLPESHLEHLSGSLLQRW